MVYKTWTLHALGLLKAFDYTHRTHGRLGTVLQLTLEVELEVEKCLQYNRDTVTAEAATSRQSPQGGAGYLLGVKVFSLMKPRSEKQATRSMCQATCLIILLTEEGR